MGHPCSYLWAGRKISVCGRSRLHAAAGAGRKVHRAARSSRFRARRGGAGQCARLRQLRRARCGRAPWRPVFAALRSPIRESRPRRCATWHRLGMRGLRFHLFSPAGRPGYVRGVGLDVFEVFRPVMRELGWIMQVWCDWRALPDVRRQAAGDLRRDAGSHRSHAQHSGRAGRGRSFIPGAAAPRGRRSSARQAVGALSPRPRHFPTIRMRAPSTRHCCAPIPNACSGVPIGRIRRSPQETCRTTASCSTCSTHGRRTRAIAAHPGRHARPPVRTVTTDDPGCFRAQLSLHRE